MLQLPTLSLVNEFGNALFYKSAIETNRYTSLYYTGKLQCLDVLDMTFL